MGKRLGLGVVGVIVGLFIGYFIVSKTSLVFPHSTPSSVKGSSNPIVMGFLPYWLLTKAQIDYSKYITQLTYFDLTVDTDGSLLKQSSDTESEPGYYALVSGKADPFFNAAKSHHVSLSVAVMSGDNNTIDSFLSQPIQSADHLTNDVIPLMKQYGFSSLNLDIEYTKEATDGARTAFTTFATEIKKNMDEKKAGMLTADITSDDLIRPGLIDPKKIANIADKVVIMGYDFHYGGSYVTGPVAPLSGANISSEYDIQAAVSEALKIMPSKKIILGVPLYGYEWETIGSSPRSAVLSGSGITLSNQRVEEFLSSCSTCSAQFNSTDKESSIIYHDDTTDTYHQMFFPTEKSTKAKVTFSQNYELGGIALWALGYEGNTILDPLGEYK